MTSFTESPSFQLYKLILDVHLYNHLNNEYLESVAMDQAKEIIQQHPNVLTTRVDTRSFRWDFETDQRRYCHANFVGEMELNDLSFFGYGNEPHPLDAIDGYIKGLTNQPYPFMNSLPLHWVTKLGLYHLVEMFVTEMPLTVSERMMNGQSPLHISPNARITQFLLEYDTSGLSVQDDVGCLPLHHAATYEQIKLLLEKYTKGAFVRDVNGHLALHYAVEDFISQAGFSEFSQYDDDNFGMESYYEKPSLSTITLFLDKMGFHSFFFPVGGDDGICETIDTLVGDQDESRSFVWERKTPCSMMSDAELNNDVLKIIEYALTRDHPILHDAIGTLHYDYIEEIITGSSSVLDMSMVDSCGRNVIYVAFERACANVKDWDDYYRHVVNLLINECNDRNDESMQKAVETYGQRNQLLLSRAIASRLPYDGIQLIVNANIDALMEKNDEGLMPFMEAVAMGSNSCLNTVYLLIRTRPDILEMI